MDHKSIPSAEALEFRDAMVPDLEPANFTNIKAIRAETDAMYAGGSQRAIDRHGLDHSDIVLGGVDCLRIRSRRGGSANGVMFYVFGGGFTMGNPESDLPIIGALADWCGVEVIAPRYRLAPEHPAPAARDDCLAAYRALCAQEPERLLVAGESAGGNLALVIAQAGVAEGLASPTALALLSPAVDLRVERSLFGPVVDVDLSLAHQRIIDVAGVYAGDLALDDPAISPLLGSMEGLPPTIITTGTHDLLMEMSLRLARSLRRAGIDVECNVWPGMWHVFEFYDDFPESAESLGDIAAFLNSR